ncbi:hypothetical protein QQS21_010199 [Conoideocrella luteorostrata]|uniref:Alpha-galactosidase n=1 Tax=Conoideocrella luteorostrata TaxID=1105319 RepID=A0AAJ0FUX5_9HYPO|nr:hypothetical protein QQS21_010199 [Conoideocrella luteorostrata]
MKPSATLTAAGLAAHAVSAAEPYLALPPMGFNNWARFTVNINESIFVDAAEAMGSRGLLSAGYNRINLDDAWSLKERAANGSMAWDPVKFPRGLPWLTAHIKSRGFIPGIYTDSGTKSCGGYPGAEDHEEINFRDFKAWGFEFLKMDGCYVNPVSEPKYHDLYTRWHKILSSAGDSMVFSDSAPAYFCDNKNKTDWYTVMGWSADYGQLARHSDDIQNYPDGGDSWKSMLINYGYHIRLARYQRPGYFNDPDFLNYDHPSYTLDEKKSHFALWSSFSAPLILSANIPAITPEEAKYLTNKDIIAIDQDPLVQQATLVSSSNDTDVLTKSLENGDRLLTIFNKASTAASITVSWERIGYTVSDLPHGGAVSVKNLWTGQSSKIDVQSGGITAKNIPRHGTAIYRIGRTTSPITPTGIIFNTVTMNCLTDSASGVLKFTRCNGSASQTWSIRSNGRVSSILRPKQCIEDTGGKVVSGKLDCTSAGWSYHQSGNVISSRSKLCLTEAKDGSALATACGRELNEQVMSLPIGVTIRRP